MKKFLVPLMSILLVMACSQQPTNPEPPTGPVVITPDPNPVPVPQNPGTWWKPGPIKKFQIIHASDMDEVREKVKKDTQVLTFELDSLVEDFEGTEVADYVHSLGAKLICYTSEGYQKSHHDEAQYPEDAKGGNICRKEIFGKCVSWWPGEKWGNPKKESLKKFLHGRFKKAKELGCDGVEPDNMDQHSNDVGFSITEEENIQAQKEIAALAHKEGLAIFQKNAGDIAEHLVDHFDGVYNESCFEYDECDDLAPYKNKLTAIMTYSKKCKVVPENPNAACNYSNDGYFED